MYEKRTKKSFDLISEYARAEGNPKVENRFIALMGTATLEPAIYRPYYRPLILRSTCPGLFYRLESLPEGLI